jgi:hypothetical protein
MRTLLCTTALLAVALFCTTGCEKVQKFTPQHERADIHLKVRLFDNERELNHYIESNFDVNKEYKRDGFSRWYAQSFDGMLDECTIFVVRGTTERLEGIYGHELMHCVYGTYHKEL